MAQTDERTVEWLKCAADAAYACDFYGIIDDAQGLGDRRGVMQFHGTATSRTLMDL